MRRVFVNDNDLLRPHPRCRTAHRAGVRTEVRQLQGNRSALQKKNDESSRVWQLMISNQCPLCSTALVPRHQAARQARTPMQKNRCITDRTEWTHPIQDPPSMACTLCGFHCSHLAQFHRHVTEEHRAPPAHLHLTLDSSDEDTRAAPTRRRADQPGENQQASRWRCSKQHQHASVVRQLGPQERPRTSPLGISHRKLLISIPISNQAGHARTRRTASTGSSAWWPPRRRTRHRRTRQQAQTFTLRRWPPGWSHRQGGLHRWPRQSLRFLIRVVC